VDTVNILADVVNRGFDWVKVRAEFRRLADSKRATETEKKKAGLAAIEAAAKLEKALIKLMQASNGMPAKKRGTALPPLDWGKLAGAISKGAAVFEDVLKKKGPGPVVEVIDTEGREVE